MSAQIVNIYTNIKTFSARLSAVAYKQVPFATAQALTELAREVSLLEKMNEEERLDRPRPFTYNAIRALPARKGHPIARVVMLDRTAGYLEPYEFGGDNVLNSKALLKPAGAADVLDQFGNLPQNYMAKMKGRADVFVGPVKTKNGVINGVWQRTSDPNDPKARVQVASVNKRTGKVTVRRTAKNINQTGKLKLLIKFTDAHPIADKNRLHWFDVAEAHVNARFNAVFGRSLARAIASARP